MFVVTNYTPDVRNTISLKRFDVVVLMANSCAILWSKWSASSPLKRTSYENSMSALAHNKAVLASEDVQKAANHLLTPKTLHLLWPFRYRSACSLMFLELTPFFGDTTRPSKFCASSEGNPAAPKNHSTWSLPMCRVPNCKERERIVQRVKFKLRQSVQRRPRHAVYNRTQTAATKRVMVSCP